MLWSELPDAVEYEDGLEVQGLLAPQGAVVVEHRDALGGGHEIERPTAGSFLNKADDG